jgi:hypothetical protein
MVTQTMYGVRKRSFRPTPKAGEQPFAPTPLSHSVGEGLGVRATKGASVNGQARCIALTPFVPLSRRRERGNAPPFAPTPLSHSVGEGLGVRATKGAGVNGQARCIALTPFVPLSRLRERGNAPPFAPTPLSHSVGEGLGVRATKRTGFPHAWTHIRGLGVGLAFLLYTLLPAQQPAAPTVRLKDIAQIRGVRTNQLVGYGIVVGLEGTGDSNGALFTVQSVANMLERFGITVPPNALKVKNVAAVIVTAELPPFARAGNTIDVVVSSIGDARSLQGGTLLQTPLAGRRWAGLRRSAGTAVHWWVQLRRGRRARAAQPHHCRAHPERRTD